MAADAARMIPKRIMNLLWAPRAGLEARKGQGDFHDPAGVPLAVDFQDLRHVRASPVKSVVQKFQFVAALDRGPAGSRLAIQFGDAVSRVAEAKTAPCGPVL